LQASVRFFLGKLFDHLGEADDRLLDILNVVVYFIKLVTHDHHVFFHFALMLLQTTLSCTMVELNLTL
jgi:hypothetical protein